MSSKDAARAAVASFGPPGASEYLLLAGISLAWGTSYMFTKVAVEELPPVMLVALRLVIAAAVMLTVVLARRMRWPSARDLAAFGVVGLLSNAAPLTLIAISVSYVDSSVTAITMALVPLITACLAVFTGSYPSIRSVVGIALGLVGVFVLFGPQAFLSFGGGTRGLIAAVAAALIFSTSLFAVRMVRHVDPVMVTALSLTSAMIWSVPLAMFLDGVPQAWPSLAATGSVLVLGLWNTAASSLLMFALLRRAGPTFTSYNNQLVPMVAVMCGTMFLGEMLTSASIAGVILVLAGVAISTARFRSPPTPPS